MEMQMESRGLPTTWKIESSRLEAIKPHVPIGLDINLFSNLDFQFYLLSSCDNKTRAQKVCVGVRPEWKMRSVFCNKRQLEIMGDWLSPSYSSLTLPIIGTDHCWVYPYEVIIHTYICKPICTYRNGNYFH